MTSANGKLFPQDHRGTPLPLETCCSHNVRASHLAIRQPPPDERERGSENRPTLGIFYQNPAIAWFTALCLVLENVSEGTDRLIVRLFRTPALGALVIADEFRLVMDVEIVPGHGNVPFRVDAS